MVLVEKKMLSVEELVQRADDCARFASDPDLVMQAEREQEIMASWYVSQIISIVKNSEGEVTTPSAFSAIAGLRRAETIYRDKAAVLTRN